MLYECTLFLEDVYADDVTLSLLFYYEYLKFKTSAIGLLYLVIIEVRSVNIKSCINQQALKLFYSSQIVGLLYDVLMCRIYKNVWYDLHFSSNRFHQRMVKVKEGETCDIFQIFKAESLKSFIERTCLWLRKLYLWIVLTHEVLRTLFLFLVFGHHSWGAI